MEHIGWLTPDSVATDQCNNYTCWSSLICINPSRVTATKDTICPMSHDSSPGQIQAGQHWLSVLHWETCCHSDWIQLDAVIRDVVHRKSLLFSQLTWSPNRLSYLRTRPLCAHNKSQKFIRIASRQDDQECECPTTSVNMRGNRDNLKGRTLYWYPRPIKSHCLSMYAPLEDFWSFSFWSAHGSSPHVALGSTFIDILSSIGVRQHVPDLLVVIFIL